MGLCVNTIDAQATLNFDSALTPGRAAAGSLMANLHPCGDGHGLGAVGGDVDVVAVPAPRKPRHGELVGLLHALVRRDFLVLNRDRRPVPGRRGVGGTGDAGKRNDTAGESQGEAGHGR